MSDFDDREWDEVDEAHVPSTEELTGEAPRTTDSANADAIVSEHGKGYLFVAEWESWIAWDGKRWDRSAARGRVVNAAMLTARMEHYRTAQRLLALEEKYRPILLTGRKDEELEAQIKHEQRLLKWHEQSQNISRLEAAAKILETRLVIALADLDKDPWLLNVSNGTVDLRTAEIRPHSQADRITQLSEVEWDEHARCPNWEAFVSQAMGQDLTLVLYLQRLIGYALTALTTEHLLAFFHGGGSNGKSTFLQVIRTMLGEYSCAAPRNLLFEDKSGQRHPEELARLYGKRMVVCAEIGEHTVLDEAKVKDLTGGDAVSCRRMRENSWDLIPTHTLFIAGNHKPVVRGDDHGIWRRIRLIPWLVKIADADLDKDLPSKLRSELPGILRWCVQGCLEWQRIGLTEPDVVLGATKEYRAESDTLGQFLEERCTFGEHERCARMDLRVQYEQWCFEAGHKPVGAKKLAARLREKGAENAKDYSNGKTRDGWKGVGLQHPTDHTGNRGWRTAN